MPNEPKEELEKTEVRLELPSPTYPLIEVVVGPRQQTHFSLQNGTYNIGRSKDNEIRLDDSSVSRRHATLTIESDSTGLQDQGSKNGTLVNGVRVHGSVPLQHGDLIKVGVVLLRYLTAPVPEIPSVEEIEKASREIPITSEVQGGMAVAAQVIGAVPHSKKYSSRWGLLIGGLGGMILLTAGFFYWLKWAKPPPDSNQLPSSAIPSRPSEGMPQGDEIPVFIEWTTTPLPGTIFLAGEMIGMAPVRINRLLKVGQVYESRILFALEEIGQTLEFNRSITPQRADSLIPIAIEAPVGLFKILALPRDVVTYLEGTFSGDPNSSHPVRLSGVAYGKPIYLPFGDYVFELRGRRQIGTTDAFIDVVLYRREFSLSEEHREGLVEATDEDLTRFPVTLRSVPSAAKVLLDGEEKGESPLETFFPLGIHELKLVKEGYFDYVESLNIQLNTPYVADISLKTSLAGEFINEARNQLARGAYNDAKGSLAEALKRSPVPSELANINLLMGRISLVTGAVREAEAYFTQAREHEAVKPMATVGLAEAILALGDKDKGLQLITEVLINAEDPEIRQSASGVFSKISPFKSSIYATSDPEGAELVVNGNSVEKKTPLILYDLGAGTYRLLFQRPGYRPYQTRVNVTVSEFKPVIVKLEPEALP